MDQGRGKNGVREAAAPAGSSPDAPEASRTPEPPKESPRAESSAAPHEELDSQTSEPPSVNQLTAGLLRLHAERMQVLKREQRTRDRFTALHPEVPVAEVAALPGDVHDLAGLRAIGDRLAGGPATGAA